MAAGGQQEGPRRLQLGAAVHKHQQAAVSGFGHLVFVNPQIASRPAAFQHPFRKGAGLVGGDGGDMSGIDLGNLPLGVGFYHKVAGLEPGFRGHAEAVPRPFVGRLQLTAGKKIGKPAVVLRKQVEEAVRFAVHLNQVDPVHRTQHHQHHQQQGAHGDQHEFAPQLFNHPRSSNA